MKTMATTITQEFAQNSKFSLLESDRLALNLLVKNLLGHSGIIDAYIVNDKMIIESTNTTDRVGKNINDFAKISEIQKKKLSVVAEDDAMSVLTSPIFFKETTVGYVVVLFSKEFINEKLSEALTRSVFLSILILICGLVLSKPLASKLLRPIFSLLEGTREVALGNFSHKIPYSGNDEIGELVVSFNQMSAELAKKEILKGAFNRYVSPQVADQILKNPDEYKLGGQNWDATILFCDIRGFTALSATMSPKELIELLNKHFTLLTEIIFHYNGTVDKFMGDAVMGVFGSPISRKDHFEMGIRAGYAMICLAEKINEIKRQEGGIEIPIGVGLDSGDVIIGNMGSNVRMEFTAIGNAVNHASRLSSVAQKDEIIINENLYQRVTEFIEVKKMRPRKIKGIENPVTPCKITGFKGEWETELNETIERIINENRKKGII